MLLLPSDLILFPFLLNSGFVESFRRLTTLLVVLSISYFGKDLFKLSRTAFVIVLAAMPVISVTIRFLVC